MRHRKITDSDAQVNGMFVNDVATGFLGDKGEGKQMLSRMGLPDHQPPFSVITFLQNRKIRWQDSDGNVAHISFRLKPEQIECSGSYLGSRKVLRVFREWSDYEDPAMIARLESQAIGDLCMRCIYEKIMQ